MNEDEIIALLKNRLSIQVTHEDTYTGGMDGGSLYRDCASIQLLLDGEVISTDSL